MVNETLVMKYKCWKQTNDGEMFQSINIWKKLCLKRHLLRPKITMKSRNSLRNGALVKRQCSQCLAFCSLLLYLQKHTQSRKKKKGSLAS